MSRRRRGERIPALQRSALAMLLVGALTRLNARLKPGSRVWRSHFSHARHILSARGVALIGALVMLSSGLSACGGSTTPQSANWTVYFEAVGGLAEEAVALNADDGTTRWSTATLDFPTVDIHDPPAVVNRYALFPQINQQDPNEDEVAGFSAVDGSFANVGYWAVAQNGSPALGGKTLYDTDPRGERLSAYAVGNVGSSWLVNYSWQVDSGGARTPTVGPNGHIYVATSDGRAFECYPNPNYSDVSDDHVCTSNRTVAADDKNLAQSQRYTSDVVADTSGFYFGDGDGYLYGYTYHIDNAPGQQKWVAQTQASIAPVGSLTLADSAVVLFPEKGSDAVADAYNESDGKLRWHFADPNRKAGQNGFTWGAPTVDNGVIYVTSQSHEVDASDIIYALDATSGAVRWSYETGNEGLISTDAPQVKNGVVYFGTDWISYDRGQHSSVYALDAANGAIRWRYDISGFGDGYDQADKSVTRLAVGPDALYVGSNLIGGPTGEMIAINLADGTKRWNQAYRGVGAPFVGPQVTSPPLVQLRTPLPTRSPAPTPTATFTPVPSPFPTTAPPVVKFVVQPTSFDQRCSASPALPSFSVNLDNAKSSVAVDWRTSITDKDPTKSEIWATASPTSGRVASQNTASVTVTPAADLCARFPSNSSAAVTFHVTITWTTGGGGSTTITDTVHPYVVG